MNFKFSEDLFLTNDTGKYLYHNYAKQMPIIDYHCHLDPQEIYENKVFMDLGEMWLAHDHYKWRAMRTFGIDEKYITGDTSYYEKYIKFSEILPKLIGNPLYIWCALELKRFFDIDEPLNAQNAKEIYDKTKTLIIEKQITPRWCMEISNVKLVTTTEDPTDNLQFHIAMKQDQALKTKVLTAYRPDKAMFIEKPNFKDYMIKLSQVSNMPINRFSDMVTVLEKRVKFFKETTGSRVSDNGIPYFNWVNYTLQEIEAIWTKAYNGCKLTLEEEDKYRSAFLFEMACMYYRNDFIMQLHVGTYLDANTSLVKEVGQSSGFDCTADDSSVKSIGELLNQLTRVNQLPKTILYPLEGTKQETWSVLAAGYCYGGIKSRVQLGAPWWFMDQPYGIQRQFEACGNLYPLSLSVGMLTDSRSFLSYPRHELYRRILCNYLGTLVERGEYFSDELALSQIIQDVCYNNVKEFFGFKC